MVVGVAAAGHDLGSVDLLFHPGVAAGVEGGGLGRIAHRAAAGEADLHVGRHQFRGGLRVGDHVAAQVLVDQGAGDNVAGPGSRMLGMGGIFLTSTAAAVPRSRWWCHKGRARRVPRHGNATL